MSQKSSAGGVHNARLGRKVVMAAFLKSSITLMKWMLILFYWPREYPVTDLADIARLHPKTTDVDAY